MNAELQRIPLRPQRFLRSILPLSNLLRADDASKALKLLGLRLFGAIRDQRGSGALWIGGGCAKMNELVRARLLRSPVREFSRKACRNL